jgi:Raf kinase inhibitor-like YbhB/YbcL family protein
MNEPQNNFTLSSTSFNPGDTIPHHYVFNGMGCKGNNISPELEWRNAPDGTKSFAVTVHDPDAHTAHGWWHWSIINIPASIHKLAEGASNHEKLPANAVEVVTDFGDNRYGGPCPPEGDKPHRYVFTVHALKKDKLDVTSRSTADEIKNRIESNSLAKASFTVKYGR